MTEKLLPCVEVDHGSTPDAAVIWLHGLGADGHDFEPVVPALQLPEDLAVRFIFPHAPSQPVTINNGWVMPAWYDILEMSIERKIDVAGLLHSVASVEALIQRERDRGIAAERIVLAGFSQGGAVAYHTALCYPERLAGLLTLSTYMATREQISTQRTGINQNLPIMIHHGTRDDVVPLSLGEQAVENLKQLGYNPEWITWPVDHGLCLEEVEAIGRWLTKILQKDTE